MLYYLGGVSGVGKSTFLQKLGESYPEIRIVKGSEAFMEWIGIEQGDYAKLRSLSDEYKDREFAKLIASIAKKERLSGGHIVLDAHYLNLRHGKIVDVIGDWLKEVDVLLLLTADTKTVLQRVEANRERERALFPKSSPAVEKFQILERYIRQTSKRAKEAAAVYDKPLFVIWNEEGELNVAVEGFLEIHKNLVARGLP